MMVSWGHRNVVVKMILPVIFIIKNNIIIIIIQATCIDQSKRQVNFASNLPLPDQEKKNYNSVKTQSPFFPVSIPPKQIKEI